LISNEQNDLNERKILNLNSLVELSVSINAGLNLDYILDILTLTCIGELQAESVAVILSDKFDEDKFILEKYKGSYEYENDTFELTRKSALFSIFKEDTRPKITGTGDKSNIFQNRIEDIKFLSPEVICPILIKDAVNGLLILGKKLNRTQYDGENLEYIETLCKIAGVAIENARLYELATFDQKTGLFMYHNFKSRANREMSRSERFKEKLSAIMIDIDFFKKINDNFGHKQGDIVLMHFGKIIRNAVRDIDIPTRFGGEEFVILCPETNKEQAYKLCLRMQDTIRKYEFPAEKGFLKVTASFGVAEFQNGKTSSIDELIADADMAMYKSKQNGRDRITLA